MISAPAKSWPLIVITFVIFIFFIKLFIPHQAIFVTPDYGRSDAWHLSIANKYYYAQELKKNRLPIWNPAVFHTQSDPVSIITFCFGLQFEFSSGFHFGRFRRLFILQVT